MPISNLVLYQRQAEAGKIKIGHLGKKRPKSGGTGEYRLPEKLNHFIITKTIREGHGRQSEDNFVVDHALMKQLRQFADDDGKLRRIPVMFDSDIVDEIFITSLASYAGRSLSCRGDGVKAQRLAVVDNVEVWKFRECPCERLRARGPNELVCKPNGTLWCTIMAGDETRIGARHAFRTTSWNSIRAIGAGLQAIKNAVGTICGIKCWLIFEEKLAKTRTGDWKRIPTVHVELRTVDILSLQKRAIEAAQMTYRVVQVAANPAVLGLPAPAGPQETKAEQAAVADEYYPPEDMDDGHEDDGEETEEVDPHDPETGEVYGEEYDVPSGPPSDSKKKPSQKPTEPGMPAAGNDQSTLGLEDYVPMDDPTAVALAEKLKIVARLRGCEEDKLKTAMKDVLAAETEVLFHAPVTFKLLKRGQMQQVLRALSQWLERRAREDAEDASDDDIPVD